jgi:hypothetical protein
MKTPLPTAENGLGIAPAGKVYITPFGWEMIDCLDQQSAANSAGNRRFVEFALKRGCGDTPSCWLDFSGEELQSFGVRTEWVQTCLGRG